MTPTFQSYCPDCWEPVQYVHGRPATHDCITDDDNNEEGE